MSTARAGRGASQMRKAAAAQISATASMISLVASITLWLVSTLSSVLRTASGLMPDEDSARAVSPAVANRAVNHGG